MPIELRTGLPGAGKTLGAVESLMHRRKHEPERPLYYHGIADLRDGLAIHLDEEGVRNWRDLPPGAVLYVDEAQKLMKASRGSDVPAWISALSEHRHLGLDFVFITQHPSLIHSYVRTLVDRHIHTVRSYGTKFVERYSWPLCMSDPNSASAKKSSESKSRHALSKEAMAGYKSAELHTIKARFPKFLKIAAALLVGVPLIAGAAIFLLRHLGPKSSSVPVAAGSSSSVSDQLAPSSGKGPISRAEWVKRQVPRVAGIPWSAEIFDDQKVQSQPDLYCMKYEGDNGSVDECSCITEQGTHAQVPHAMCLAFAMGGVYNPYRAPIVRNGNQSVSTPGGGDRSEVSQKLPESAAIGSSSHASERKGISDAYIPPTYGPWNPDPFGGGGGR